MEDDKGRLVWNPDSGTLDINLEKDDVVCQVGEEVISIPKDKEKENNG